MFQHKSIHWIHSASFNNANQTNSAESCASASANIFFHLVVEIEVVGSSVQKETSAVIQCYVTGFAAQLSGFRRSGQVNFLFGFKESNSEIRCPYFRVAHADAGLLSTSRSVVKKLNYQIRHHSGIHRIRRRSGRNYFTVQMYVFLLTQLMLSYYFVAMLFVGIYQIRLSFSVAAKYGFTLSIWTTNGFAFRLLWISTITGDGVRITRNGPLNWHIHFSGFPWNFRGLK